jgi:hypothetical protein
MLFLVVISFSSFWGSTFQKISKNRRTPDSADETDESKPNSRMIKTRMMGVTLMTLVIGKKLPRRGGRPEHRATDSRWQTRKRRSSLSLALLDLSSRYFLKHSNKDISRNVKFFRHALSARAIRAMPSCYQPTIRAQRYAAIRQTSGLSIVNPTAMLETKGPVKCLSVEIGTRSKRNFHRPESNCGVAINSG